ncbi:oxepin-CoA hydrolase, alternative type [Piscinibacter koreensis]|uniref:Enoyl-CoA hydratase/isomerase family protein n=1 Tax=Piscinibacter koreensis TaxID=2742824 RepID=A0A7Y6TYN1_9BURK|nr:enoyl-CoA hydratase family protein [Schlegelella koreensis]NUZ08282.1 enoyl-CoA hydratase/isomerase family protein [Schlegelella koreensis]
MPSELLTERIGPVLVLTISDPATRNTLSAQVISAGIESLGVAESDPAVRVVVLRGAGDHFCAGGNVSGLIERRAAGRDTQRQMIDRLHQLVEAIRVFPKPVIAAVEGAAAGAGFGLALAADMIVASREARFMLSYAKLGLSPDAGTSWHLLQSLPRALVQQLVWLADPVPVATLHAMGLVNAVAEPGSALTDSMAIAERLCAMAPNALASAKELVNQAPGRTLNQQLACEREHFIDNLFHPNGDEGLRAFIAKRPPEFSSP